MTTLDTQKIIKEVLEEASKAYYEGEPTMSDEEFDMLAEYINYNDVGYIADENKAQHTYQMYSLQKVFKGDPPPHIFSEHETVVTPKLDGAAISLLYYGGLLVSGLTRGNGKVGTKIGEKVKYLVPEKISIGRLIQITGEVVVPKEVPNARNLAAGSLNLKDIEEFKSRPLNFIAYGVHPNIGHSFSHDMEYLKECGFNTVLDNNWNDYPQDGSVFRIDDNEVFEGLGYTAHHPRGAFALKENKEGVVTKLLSVEWQVGKSGVVSPVGIVEPVEIDDAIVSRVTLNNISYIDELQLEIGCLVEIVRSGDIIPRVMRRAY